VLDQIVKKLSGIILLFVVGSLSLVFLVQFGGPQGDGCSSQKAVGAAAEVYGHAIGRNEFQAAFTLVGGENYPDELLKESKLRANVLDGLIERDLLAREARRVGFNVTDDEVLRRVADDGLIHMSMAVDAGPRLPVSGAQKFSFADSKGQFSKDNLKRFIQYRLRRSVHEFAMSQIEETLADRMRQTVISNVSVGPGETWDAYVREKESVTLQYVRLSNAYYAQQVAPTEQEIVAFMAAEQKAVDAEYERQKQRYTGLEKQVKARHILIKVDSSAGDEQKLAARKTIDGLLLRARAGEDFAALAKQFSQDEGSGKIGGDLGFNPKGRMVKPFDDAQFALKQGEISDVVESTFGFHIIKAEAIREGDVPLAEAKRELAEKLLRDGRAADMAKQAAADVQQKVTGGMTLEAAAASLIPPAAPKTKAKPGAATDEEELPPAIDPFAPQVVETRPFGRTDTPIPGPFDSTPLAKVGYELTEAAPLGTAPIKLGDDWFVYRLSARTVVAPKEWKPEDQQRIEAGITRRRQSEALRSYVHKLRERAAADNALFVDDQLLKGFEASAPQEG
jgi:peptidyl-prolyl cis-trans isomerase D